MVNSIEYVIDDDTYKLWKTNLDERLEEILKWFVNTPKIEVVDTDLYNALQIAAIDFELLKKSFNNFIPLSISYCKVFNQVEDFEETEIRNKLMKVDSLSKNLAINTTLTEKEKEFDFLKHRFIGYRLYFHFSAVTYFMPLGFIMAYKQADEVFYSD